MLENKEYNLIVKEANDLSEFTITAETLADPKFSKAYSQLLNLKAVIEAVDEKVRADVKEIAKENYLATGESSIKVEDYMFTYCSESTRENFDKKAFKAEYGDAVYNKFVKISNVKDSIKVSKIKAKDDDTVIDAK